MSQCDHYQELISRLIDEDLDAKERAELEEHLKTCPDCTLMFEAFAKISDEIGGELEDVPLDLRESVMAEIRREELRRRERLPAILRIVMGVAAAFAVVAGVTLGVSPTLRDRLAARATGAEMQMISMQASSDKAAPEEAAAMDTAADEGARDMEAAAAGVDEAMPEEEAYFDDIAPESDAASAATQTAVTDAAPAEARTDAAEQEPLAEETEEEAAPTQELAEPEAEPETRDLTGWLELSSLRTLLGAGETELDRAALQQDAKLVLLVRHAGESCSVTIYEHEGKLYWYDPSADAVYLSDLTWQQLLDFLG